MKKAIILSVLIMIFISCEKTEAFEPEKVSYSNNNFYIAGYDLENDTILTNVYFEFYEYCWEYVYNGNTGGSGIKGFELDETIEYTFVLKKSGFADGKYIYDGTPMDTIIYIGMNKN